MPRVALVDDDRNILTSLSITLEAEGFEVETHHDGRSALEAFERRLPDVALIDITMPRMDGLELLERLRARSDLPVALLTSRDDEVDEVLGLRMGADEYLRKPFSPRVVVARLRALLRRSAPETDAPAAEVLCRGALWMDPRRHEVRWNGQPVVLTVTEYLLLEALARHPGFVRSRDQLMSAAYADGVFVDDRTIDSHIKRLRRKLRQVDPGFAAIETLYGIGYRYAEAPVDAA